MPKNVQRVGAVVVAVLLMSGLAVVRASTATAAASAGATAVAQQLVSLIGTTISGNSWALDDLRTAAAGQPIHDCPEGPTYLQESMLQGLLNAQQQYRIRLGYFTTQHGCDGLGHQKGLSVDIASIQRISDGLRSDFHNGSAGDNPGLNNAFVAFLSYQIPNGSWLGQRSCNSRTGAGVNPAVGYGNDSCNHQHYNVPAGSKPVGGSTALTDGQFVQVSTTGEVYRIAGGAPLHLTSWAPFGGAQPVTVISPAQFQALAPRPANGTDLKAAGGNQVWRVAGGAALRVANCVVGSTDFCSHAIAVDPATVALHDHLDTVPANGTDLIAAGSGGEVFRVAGGAALRAYQCQVGDTNFCADGVIVDGLGIVGPGNPFTRAPANGTDLIAAGSGGDVFRIAGGAALPVSTCTIGGTDFCGRGVVVDGLAIVGPNTPLFATPAEGTDLVSAADGKVWRTAGGAAFPVSACTIGTDQFCSRAVRIDPVAVTNHLHVNAAPTPGTAVTTVPDNRTYTFATTASGSACLAPATTANATHLDRTGVTAPAC